MFEQTVSFLTKRKPKQQPFDRKRLSSLWMPLDKTGKSYELCYTEITKKICKSLF